MKPARKFDMKKEDIPGCPLNFLWYIDFGYSYSMLPVWDGYLLSSR